MPHLSSANLDIEHNPFVTLYLSDGRAFLVGKDQTYDAIISTVTAPTYFSASKIYTLDFYERVRKSLKPDGTFTCWMAVGDMSGEGMMTILSALRHNFRYCELHILRSQYYLVTCSNRPIQTRRRFSEVVPAGHRLAKLLQMGLPALDLDEFFEDILLSENIFERFTPQVAQENTDDHPVLEFMAVRSQELRKAETDPFIGNEQLLNIDTVREQDKSKDAGRFARRAIVFWRLGSKYYEKDFQPILLREPNITSEFLMEAAEYKIIDDKVDEAIGLLNTVLRIKPDSAEAYNKMGSALAAQGKFDEAIDHLRRAIQIKPDFVEAYKNLGDALAVQNKLDEAIQNFQQALARNKQSVLKVNTANVHYNLAAALKKLGRLKEAAEEFAKAAEEYPEEIAKNPGSIKIYVNLGDALAESGNLDEAIKNYRTAVELNPTIPDNQYKLTQALESGGRLDEAIEVLKKQIPLMKYYGQDEATAKFQRYLDSLERQKPK
jgi:tetratricopeptide (TPR) repeat protein